MSKDFLLEIGTEEMPARFIKPVLKQLKTLAEDFFDEHRLKYIAINTYATPRRLVLAVKELAGQQDALVKEVKGPAKKVAFDDDGNPTAAVLGFARGQGVAVADLTVRLLAKAEYMYALVKQEGQPVSKVLSTIIPQIISRLHFPKPMRWGYSEYRFGRPLRWILALFGREVVPLVLAGLNSDRYTYGHRFLSTGAVEVNEATAYFEVMRQHYVIVDGAERKRIIWQQVQQLANAAGGRVQADQNLLDEITNIVEYPTALIGSFAEHYLKLPAQVIITPMREHQRYFPVLNAATGKLAPKFIAVRNGIEKHLKIVTAGNEKVLSARLADAAFFFKADLKTTLIEKLPSLKKVVWLEGLGTVYEKTGRITRLAEFLAKKLKITGQQKSTIHRAAQLCKADLITNMVYEFPELQGIIGREYALRNCETEAVAQAIREHYLPRHAEDSLPGEQAGQLLSLADKLDSITGCFAAGIQPTGSQDPYALRRQALGIVRIILETELSLSLKEMIITAYRGYLNTSDVTGDNSNSYKEKTGLKLNEATVLVEVTDFFRQRLKGVLMERGLAYDTVDAVLAVGFDDLAGTWQRGRALAEFRQQAAFIDLCTVFNRVNNLAKKSNSTGEVNQDLLRDQVEKDLYQADIAFGNLVTRRLEDGNYTAVLSEMAKLLKPINAFFEQVLVMVEDDLVRNNRLALLASLAHKTKAVADFSKIII
ncbi:MAG: glycine--tRNA ligase subunit beta [Desulfotomaculum sp.]|nr:glycine--tRNA ligase subunit beta [Desulfotomaculum sp.]MCL0080634.1 glycine--tRNA ligase subunit beta [Peptococcaceae bacterium]